MQQTVSSHTNKKNLKEIKKNIVPNYTNIGGALPRKHHTTY